MGAMRVPVPPLFGLRGTILLIFQDEKVKNLRSPAVNSGDLWRLNYNKTVFGLDSTWTAHRPHSWMGLPRPLSFWDPKAPHYPSELVPPLSGPKLRPLR